MLNSKEIDELVAMLCVDEGFRPRAYDDVTGREVRAPVGWTTIGIGTNISMGLTFEEAKFLCVNRLTKTEKDLIHYFEFYEELDSARKIVLLNMAYNMGARNLMKFKKMLSAIQKNDYATAANEMLSSHWASQVGKRSKRLANIMETGKYNVGKYE